MSILLTSLGWRHARYQAVALAAACALVSGGQVVHAKSTCEKSTDAPECRREERIRAAQTRADSLIAQMSLEEKLQLVRGTGVPGYGKQKGYTAGYAGRVAGIPRLGIPDLLLADGPNGVGNASKDVTAFASPLSMSASWDPALVQKAGEAIGREHAGKAHNVALAPMFNIVRIAAAGRTFESFSEDPYLNAKIANAEIIGIQSQGVIATAKHFAVNNQENDRAVANADIGERPLREIYLSAFESAVKDAGVVGVMCAYNKVNTDYACENKTLTVDILQNEWGFPGFVVSDWAATHDTVKAANGGLDMEMPHGPSPDYPMIFDDRLKAAVEEGKVPVARLNDMVRRVLVAMIDVGILDRPPSGDQAAPVSTPEHQQLTRTLAEQGTVLLKNNQSILPLDSKKVRSIAVIGAAADKEVIYTGFGSAKVNPSKTVTPLAGIRARAGEGVKVAYAQGTAGIAPLPELTGDVLTAADGKSKGLTATYYASPDFSGEPVATRVEPKGGFMREALEGLKGVWSARWAGTITPTVNGAHRFSLSTYGIAKVFINDKLVLNAYGPDRAAVAHSLVELKAGVPAAVRIEYVGRTLPRRIPQLAVGWLAPDPGMLQEAVDAAKSADIAIVFASDSRVEGGDLPGLALPGDQDQLIEAVTSANPRTVVVLNTGGPVLMPWLDRVPGLAQAWYPGQESGSAIASVLFGDVNPAGKLPLTFPRSDKQIPTNTAQQWPGVDGVASYSEGLLVGYRWYDAKSEEPLFPFGYGLSYTSFSYDAVKATPRKDADGQAVDVKINVSNTGSQAGAEVVQLYLASPPTAGEPPKQLKGFKKVNLKPNESATVSFTLNPRDLSIWDEVKHKWIVPKGSYQIMIGSSSRDIRASQNVSID